MSYYFEDQLSRKIKLDSVPQRIISLVPSQSELLWDLGLESRLKGITKFCEFPKSMFQSIEKIGGTKTVNIQKIRSLSPDLIIANKEENVKEQIEALEEFCPVWCSDVKNLANALSMIKTIGQMTHKFEKAEDICNRIQNSFGQLSKVNKSKAIYLIWKNPYISVGEDTFINEMLEAAGYTNSFAIKKRYPATTIEEIQKINPKIIFLSSEPFPFGENHKAELEKECPNSVIQLVDGSLFSWYGSRLLLMPEYFAKLRSTIYN